MKHNTAMASRLLTSTGVIMLILLLSACKKESFESGSTKTFTLVSTSYGASYDIKVGLPADYNASAATYATVYVLDGKDNFEFVANKCQAIAAEVRRMSLSSVSAMVVTGVSIIRRLKPAIKQAAPTNFCILLKRS